MSTIHIEWLDDCHDCETCGPTYSDGARVTIDGVVALELVPHAYCFDGDNYDRDDVFRRILAHLGHDLTES